MYRATLIFSYSFSLSGYYTYFGYPIPLSQLCLGYFLSFSASIPFLPLRPGYFLHFSASIPFFPLRLGYFLHFSTSIPFLPLRPGISCTFRPPYPSCRCARVFSALFGLYTLFPAAPWVFSALFGFSYPRNTEILCMSFSYNTQDSIGKRFPQPFL